METYDGEDPKTWLRGLNQMAPFNERYLMAMFALFGIPETMLDVGCGDGAMVKFARKIGVRAYGIDQLVGPEWEEHFFHVNLVDRFEAPEPVDVVTCFEVAEHIHPNAHATLAGTLCDNLKTGVEKYLVFCAARPGQDGTGHVACRPAAYWHEEFIMRGMTYNRIVTQNLALLWANIQCPLPYMYDNLIVFNK